LEKVVGDPVPSSAISDATTGGLSVIVITGGSTGQVLTLQANGTYAPATISAGIGGSVGSTDNRLVRSDGTGGSTVQSTSITVDDSNNLSGVANVTSSGEGSFGGLVVGGNGGFAFAKSGGAIQMFGFGANYSLQMYAGGALNTHLQTTTKSSFARGISCSDEGGTGSALSATGNVVTTAMICAGTYTVATLPSAAANAYKFATVSDSSVTTFGTAVAGSGSSNVMVFSNGTNWTVFAI
jgi:hypothetical protein